MKYNIILCIQFFFVTTRKIIISYFLTEMGKMHIALKIILKPLKKQHAI